MTDLSEGRDDYEGRDEYDIAPGVTQAAEYNIREGIQTYTIGLVLAVILTGASFYVVRTPLIWGPAIPTALIVLAIAQMGVHLVFFLHITTDPDNTNNTLALAFGVLIVVLILGGTLWIMGNLNDRLMLPNSTMQMPP